MASTSPDVQAELTRRHKHVSTTVISLVVATILLAIIAFLGRRYYTPRPNAVVDMAVRLLVLFLGLGAIAFRRYRFNPMRLQDIAGLAGPSGLLKTLEKTTLQLALVGIGITIVGFMSTLVMGDDSYTYWSAAVALVVLFSAYPRKSTWNRVLNSFTAKDSQDSEDLSDQQTG